MYKFLIFCFFLVANLYVAQSVSVWNIFDTVSKRVLIAAHRGDFKNYPENSIPGILSCITQGVDIVEIDVQKTSDGHFVLMHDPKLNRTTNGKGKVSQRTLKYILGLKLKDAKGNLTNYSVPTLDSVLKIIKGKIILNIDKSNGIFDQLIPIIQSHQCDSFVILKGNNSAAYFNNYYKLYPKGPLFMPIKNGSNTSLDSFLITTNTKLIEILLKSDSDFIFKPSVTQLIHSLGCKLWFNPLFNSISGGHTEHINAIQSWDWFIQHEAKIIQTDFPFELMEYLIGQKLHPKPPNFKMPGLKNLPNGNPQKNIKKTTLTSKKSSLRRNKKIKKYKKGLKKH